MRLAVLASGRGSNLQAILNCISRGELHARVVLVLSNVPDAPALGIAQAARIPTWAQPHKKYPNRAAFDTAMLGALREAKADTIALAGYMRILSPLFLQAYHGRVLNVHPSLLPAFPGADGAGDTLAYGAKFAGCTVHFVEEAMDMGPVIIQAAIAVRENDTKESLLPRIHAMEHRIYPQALQWLATDRLRQRGRVVQLPPPPPPAPGEPAPPMAEYAAIPDNCIVNPPLEKGF